MADEKDLADSITPSPVRPGGVASVGGRKLRPRVLRDRPIVDTPIEAGDPDPEVSRHRLRKAIQDESRAASPGAHQQFYNPDRFNWNAVQGPQIPRVLRFTSPRSPPAPAPAIS